MWLKKYRTNIIFFGGAILFFLVIQVMISTHFIINDFWNTILRQGAVMGIVCLGLNLIYGFNGQFSLGQWGFYAIGAYTAADITYRWVNDKSAIGLIVVLLAALLAGAMILFLQRVLGRVRGLDALSAFTLYLLGVVVAIVVAVNVGRFIAPAVTAFLNLLPAAFSLQVVFFLAVVLAGLVAAEVSFIFGLPVLTLGSDYFGIATLGFTIIVYVLFQNSDTMFGFEEMKGARGMIGIPKMTTWLWVSFFLLATVVIMRNLLHSTYGRAILSVREDEIAAKAMGVDIAQYKTLAFVIGSLFAGIAGGLYAHINGFLHPDNFNFIKSFDPLIVVVFGGLGSVTGTLAASFTWPLVLEGLLRLLPQEFIPWRYVFYPLLLLLMMLLKPSGLFGEYEIPFLRRELPPLKKKFAEASLEPPVVVPPEVSK